MSDLNSVQIFVTLSASLFSGLIGLGISTWHYRRFEVRRIKLDTLRKFIANRHDIVGDEFTRSLNEIFIVFNKTPSVMKALSVFHEKIVARQEANDSLLVLLKMMCADLGIDYGHFNDSFFLRPFNTRNTVFE